MYEEPIVFRTQVWMELPGSVHAQVSFDLGLTRLILGVKEA